MAGSRVLRELQRVRGAGGGWQRGLEHACGGWKTLWWAGRGARVDPRKKEARGMCALSAGAGAGCTARLADIHSTAT